METTCAEGHVQTVCLTTNVQALFAKEAEAP